MRPEDTILDEVVGDMRRVIVTAEGSAMTWHVLVGPHGAVQFAYLELHPKASEIMGGQDMMGADVGYHAYEPRYEGQVAMDCEWLVGQRQCFYDGSGLAAEDWLREWRATGLNASWVWDKLLDLYRHTFESEVSHGLGHS